MKQIKPFIHISKSPVSDFEFGKGVFYQDRAINRPRGYAAFRKLAGRGREQAEGLLLSSMTMIAAGTPR